MPKEALLIIAKLDRKTCIRLGIKGNESGPIHDALVNLFNVAEAQGGVNAVAKLVCLVLKKWSSERRNTVNLNQEAMDHLALCVSILSFLHEPSKPANAIVTEQAGGDICICANCGFRSPHDGLPQAKDLWQRLTPGEIYTDVECPHCGALCFPSKQYQPD